MEPLPRSEGSRFRHVLRLTLRNVDMIAFLLGFLGPAGLLAPPKFKPLPALGFLLPPRIPLSRLAASPPPEVFLRLLEELLVDRRGAAGGLERAAVR